MRMVEHASMSSQAMLEQLVRSKMRKGLRIFVAHLRRRASSNGRRNFRTSRVSAASKWRAFDRRSTTSPSAQGAQGLEHLAAHLARLSILRCFRNVSRDEKLHFSTTSTRGEEKCGAQTGRILSTFEPCRELSTEFFAATSARLRLSPRSKVQSPESEEDGRWRMERRELRTKDGENQTLPKPTTCRRNSGR